MMMHLEGQRCLESVRKGVVFLFWKVAGVVRLVLVLPKVIMENGGWPWYLFVVVHVLFVGPMVLMKVKGALSTPHVFAATKSDDSLAFVLDTSKVGPASLSEEGEARVRAEILKTSEHCSSLGPTQSQFCEHMVNRELLSEWNSYQKGRAKCKWESTRDFEMFYSKTTEDQYYNLSTKPGHPLYDITISSWSSTIRGDYFVNKDYKRKSPLTKNHEKMLQKCSFAADRGTWHVNRIGPFEDRSVGSWHYAWFQPFADLPGLPETIGKYAVATMTNLADDDGLIVAYPPVHMHHFHVWNVNPLSPIWPHVAFNGFETHGDDMCAGLGSACYMKSWPPGYGIPMTPRYFFEALANFVAESPREPFWFEVSMLVSDDPKTKATIPLVPHAPDLMSAFPQQAGTYEVPKDGESMTWGLSQADFDLELVWWKFHTHYYFTDEAWIIAGDATEALGLGEAPFKLHLEPFKKSEWPDHDSPKVSDVFETSEDYIKDRYPIPGANTPYKQRYLDLGTVDMDHQKAKDLLLARMKDYNDNKGGNLQFIWQVKNVMDFHENVDGKYWTRRPLTPPTKTIFKQGEKQTIIVFHKRNTNLCGDACEESKQPPRLHFLVNGESVPLDPAIRFLSSTSGAWVAYYVLYYPATITILTLALLAGAVAWAAHLFLRGKCVPTHGPCAVENVADGYKPTPLNDEDDDDADKTLFSGGKDLEVASDEETKETPSDLALRRRAG